MAQGASKSETKRLIKSFELGHHSKVLLHRQLLERLKEAIVSGQINPGSKIPPSRVLAAELTLARNTVLLAYELLALEDLADAHVGRGTIVRRLAPVQTGASPTILPDPTYRGPAEPISSLNPFSVGVPAYDHFPFRVWNAVVGRCARHQQIADLVYQTANGHPGLRQLLAAYLLTRRGLKCEPDQIFIVAGYQGGLALTVHALLERSGTIWIEDPGHPPTRRALSRLGVTTVAIPADEQGIDVSAGLLKAPEARMAVITPVHQFPLGVTLSAERRRELVGWAQVNDRWIIEDDYDTEFHFVGRPPDALAAASTKRVIYIGTFSKVLYPSLRIGYVVVPPELVGRFAETRQAIDHHQPLLMQDVVHRFIDEGHFDRHLGRMRSLYRERQLALVDALSIASGGRLRPLSTTGGTHLAAISDDAFDDISFVEEMARIGNIKLAPLSAFAADLPEHAGLVLGFSNCPRSALEPAMRALARALG